MSDRMKLNASETQELVNELEAGEDREAVLIEIGEICEDCQPFNTLMRVDLCPIWKLKIQFRDIEVPVEKSIYASDLPIGKMESDFLCTLI